MRPNVLRAVLAAQLILTPAMAGAQAIRGIVVDRAEVPVAGVIIQLLDAKSAIVARALSSERGEYRVIAGPAGTYRIRTLRIGYRPALSEPIRLATGEEVTRRIALDDIPFSLDTVKVAGRNACNIRADTAAATFAIWEQVRGALTAAQLTVGNRGLNARIVAYQRTMDPGRRKRVMSQTVQIREGVTSSPWKALSVDSLRRVGYVTQEIDGVAYYAPDLNVLLSDAFIDDHCLRIAQNSDANRVGIAFEPTRERRNLPDIKGTMWLDRRTSELQRMEFEYVNLPPAQQDAEPGGDMNFVRLKNGAWMISRWHIRMPVVQLKQRVASGTGGFRGGMHLVDEAIVREIKVEGGDLALLMRSNDTLWARPPMILAGTVLDSATGARVASARVSIKGTHSAATTDSLGRFRLLDVLPGEYTLDVSSPALLAIGAAHSIPLQFTDSASLFTFRVPTPGQLLGSHCGSTPGAIIAGSVQSRGDSLPPRNVRVVADWVEFAPRASEVLKIARQAEARTDARGAYRLCGIPVNTALVLRLEADRGSAPPVDLRIPAGTRIASADLVLDPDARGTAVLAGIVMSDVDARPIAEAEVALPELGQNVFTDSAGRFRLVGIPAGPQLLAVRKVGYKPYGMSMSFDANQRVERSLLLSTVQTLEAVTVEAVSPMASFEENMKRGLGKFVTRAELEKQEGRRMQDVVAQFPGVKIVQNTGGMGAALASTKKQVVDYKGQQTGPGAPVVYTPDQGFCYPVVFVNASMVYRGRIGEPLFDINSVSPAMVEAIEFYESAALAPPRYAPTHATCGILVIHTRRSK